MTRRREVHPQGVSQARALFRSLRETETRRSLRTLFLALPPLLALLGAFHLVAMPAPSGVVNAVAAWALAVAVLLVRFGLLDAGSDARWAVPTGVFVGILLAAAVWVLLYTVGEPWHVVYFVPLLLGSAFFIISVPAYIVVLFAVAAGFSAAVMFQGYDEVWLHAGFPLGLAAVLGGIILSTRLRFMKWVSELRRRDELQKTSTGRSFQQARALETQVRALAELAFEGIIILRDGVVLDLNEAAAELLAMPHNKAVGGHLNRFLMHEEHDRLEKELESFKAEGDRETGETGESVWRLHDGRTIEVEARSCMIPYRGGTAQVVVVRDVTEQRRDQREREAIRARLERILESAGEGVYGVDREGRVVFANGAAARMLGIGRDRVVGLDAHDSFHKEVRSGDPYPRQECPLRKTLLEGKVVNVDDELYWRPDGTSFPVSYVASPLVEDGETRGAVVVFQDTTEREEMDRMKDELISVVGHELKTPLSSIHGSLRLIEGTMSSGLSPEALRLIKIAGRNSDRLTRLVNDLLDVERMRAGRLELDKAEVRARDLVNDSIIGIQNLADSNGVRLEATGDDVVLDGDRDRLLQALTNLLSNAVKYSPPGGKVRVMTRAETDRVRFEVHDEGPGIPQGMHGRLFQRFSQLDSSDSRTKGGSGLGLVITRSIVEAHGGEVGLLSTEGKGSTFFILLPLNDDGRVRTRPSG